MRILYMIDSFGVGGAETLLLDLLDAARLRGIETHVAYFTPGPLEPEVRARAGGVTRLATAGLKDPRAIWRALRLIRRFRPDVLHTHLTKSDLVGQIAGRLAAVPLRVLSFHNTDRWRRKRWLTAMYRVATAGAQVRIAVSDQVADHVAECGTVLRARVRVVANGVDLARFDPANTTPFDLKPLGVAQSDVTIAVIGRLTVQKDHANFLRAAARLAAIEPLVRFLIVGEGELREALEQMAKGLGLGPERLTFTGVIREMPALLQALDVVVLPSAWEGLPMVMLEAMAMARPVVATNVGEIPGVIVSGQNGLLVPKGDDAALAQAIATLIRDPALRAALGEAGRATVRADFGASAMIDRLFAIYARQTLA